MQKYLNEMACNPSEEQNNNKLVGFGRAPQTE